MRRSTLFTLVATLATLAGSATALAQVGTAFTYQGQVKAFGGLLQNPGDFQFTLWNAATAGAQVVPTVVSALNVPVTDGLFTVPTVDFGVNPYTSDQAMWLEISVRYPAGAGPYTKLTTRQRLSATPFSMATRGINVGTDNSVSVGPLANPLLSINANGTIRSILPRNTFNGMIEAYYGDSDRYGIAQTSGGLALYMSDTYTPGSMQFGRMGAAGAFKSLLRLDYDGSLTMQNNANVAFRMMNGAATIAEIGVAASTGAWSSDASTNDIVFRNMSGNSGILIQAGSGGSGLWVNRWNNVGIGMGPAGNGGDKLRVNGSIKAVGQIGVNNVFYGDVGLSVGMRPGVDNWAIVTEGPAKFKGYTAVGSGPFQSLAMLEVRGNLPANIGGGYYFNSVSTGLTPRGTGVLGVSIIADAHVCAPVFVAFSDARTKTIVGRSDTAKDLSTIMNLEITDYTFKDVVAKGTGSQKKVIAQQVEQVYPQAVVKTTDVVPDIYKQAAVSDGWITLATDLKVGEKVRLIGEKEEGLHDVLEVRADGSAFRTAFKPVTDKVFVYGRQVKDFMSVDYEAIAMLNVSATQELARQHMAQQKRIDELEQRLQSGLEKLETALAVQKLTSTK